MILGDKVALVASSRCGTGAAIAKRMARCGAKVVVAGAGGARSSIADARGAHEIVQEIRAVGLQAMACDDDMATMVGGERIIQSALAAFGRLDILVNGADVVPSRSIFGMTQEAWDAEVTAHLKAYLACTRPASALFRGQRSGRIVNFSSDAGLVGQAGQSSNAAAEGAVNGLTRVAALDLAKYGVTVNTVVPASLSIHRPTDPAMQVDNIAALVAYLASDAAESISGQTFRVEGNRISLLSNPRPVRAIYNDERWTTQALIHAIPSSLSPAYFEATGFHPHDR
ncbi:MAG: SDR family NAD(P)-dependent oxidoreductase [Rubrivivax sp.]